jgi:hypothetical protein
MPGPGTIRTNNEDRSEGVANSYTCPKLPIPGTTFRVEPLLPFAAITDEPPAEVAAAGHDRCIIPTKPENVDAWLNPNPTDLKAQYAILDDRERPYYEHRLAA